MKFTTATAVALGVAPLALAKSVHNVYPGRRAVAEEVVAIDTVGSNSVVATEAQIAELERALGLNRGRGVEVNLLWVNLGGGAATTVINAASTVTVTQTVGGGAAATPPVAVATGAAGTTAAGGAPPPPPPPAATVVAGKNPPHNVTVGGPAGLAFNPPEIKAAVGDTVIFTFLSQNHTVTQSAFNTPCEPLQGGMDSGFQPNVDNKVIPAPQVAMQVMVDTPLWFFCRQKGHCGKGMTFSINPTAAKTQAMFQAMAIAQNGTGSGSAITGNGGAAAGNNTNTGNTNAGAAAGAAASGGSSSSLAPLPTATGAAGGPGSTGVVMGTGQVAADGSCVCAVQCSFPGFPNNALQGRDSFGGFGGSVPMAAVPMKL